MTTVNVLGDALLLGDYVCGQVNGGVWVHGALLLKFLDVQRSNCVIWRRYRVIILDEIKNIGFDSEASYIVVKP